MADPLGGIIDMAREVEREAKKLKQGVLLHKLANVELTHIVELAGKIERAARIGVDDVQVLEKVIDEAHDAIDGLEPQIGKAPTGTPRTRVEWVKKQIGEVKQVLWDLHGERFQVQEAIDALAAQLGWRVPGRAPPERINWITAKVRELQRGEKR